MFAQRTKKTDAPAATAVPTVIPADPAINEELDPIPANARIESRNVICKGTVIQGNIVAEGDLLIEGTVRGDVTTKTTLIVGPTCVIEGNIVAEHAEVAGQVRGTVQALGLLIIKSSSMIDGDVLTKNLNVESGSTFNGRFTVGAVTTTKKADHAPKIETTVLGSEIRRPAPAITPMVTKV